MSQPILTTARLELRPFCLDDAACVQRLAGDRAIADTTLNVPHPYPDGIAEAWIDTLALGYRAGTLSAFAIVRREDEELVGAMSLKLDRELDKGELGYWVGRPFWNAGFATEAAEAVLEYGFESLGLNRIVARHFVRNPASGRVMEKIGLLPEGTARQDAKKWGVYEDLKQWAILREDWRG